jgi:hypothetical protein
MVSLFTRTAIAAGLLLLAADGARSSHDHELPQEELHVRGVLRVERARNQVYLGDTLYTVQSGTRYVVDEQEVSFRQLASYVRQHPGLLAEAELSGLTPGMIVGLEIEDQEELASEVASVHGTLTRVDVDAKTLTVLPEGQSVPVTFQVDADTDLQYDFTELTLAQLAAGIPSGWILPIRVSTVAGSTVAEEVELELPVTVLTSVLRRYDAKRQTLSLRHLPEEYQLLPSTVIGRVGRLYEPRKLRVGQRVTLVSFSSGGQHLLFAVRL